MTVDISFIVNHFLDFLFIKKENNNIATYTNTIAMREFRIVLLSKFFIWLDISCRISTRGFNEFISGSYLLFFWKLKTLYQYYSEQIKIIVEVNYLIK